MNPRRRRAAASLLLLVLFAPLLPAAALPQDDAPMACCLNDGSCECRSLVGLTRCPSESGIPGIAAPQRVPGLVVARIRVTPPAARPLPATVEADEKPPLPDEPSVPPPRA